jgi:hypothetical protein
MSERDLKRVEILNEVLSGRWTVVARAAVLAISARQAHRLLVRDEAGDGAELIHKARAQTSNRSVNVGIQQYAVDLVKTRYADFGPTLARSCSRSMTCVLDVRRYAGGWWRKDFRCRGSNDECSINQGFVVRATAN